LSSESAQPAAVDAEYAAEDAAENAIGVLDPDGGVGAFDDY
jgi:hypothetical protein